MLLGNLKMKLKFLMATQNIRDRLKNLKQQQLYCWIITIPDSRLHNTEIKLKIKPESYVQKEFYFVSRIGLRTYTQAHVLKLHDFFS